MIACMWWFCFFLSPHKTIPRPQNWNGYRMQTQYPCNRYRSKEAAMDIVTHKIKYDREYHILDYFPNNQNHKKGHAVFDQILF